MPVKNIQAIVVDDELNSRELLSSMLERYCPHVKVAGLATSVEQAAQLVEKHSPDLVFLDIEMPHGSGFELLKKFEAPSFEVIFVTGFDHYALKAIKVHALDYLLKPLDIDELIEAVQKVEKRLAHKLDTNRIKDLIQNISSIGNAPKTISIPTSDGKLFVPTKDIIYCKADGPCTWIFTTSRRIYSSKNLGEYVRMLPDTDAPVSPRFFRTHHSYLINLEFARQFNRRESYLELTSGEKIPISQRRRGQYQSILKQYYSS